MKKSKEKSILKFIIFIIFIVNIMGCKVINLSKKSKTVALKEMNSEVKRSYPFLEHKRLEADRHYETAKNKIENNKDDNYELYIREYFYNFKDGHAFVKGDKKLKEKYIGGSFGIGFIKTDDKRYIVNYINDRLRDKIYIGAEILKWNNMKIEEAIRKSNNALWSENMKANKQNIELDKIKYLSRAGIGEKIEIEYRYKDKIYNLELTADKDDYYDLNIMNEYYPSEKSFFRSPIKYKIIDSEIAYIRVDKFMPSIFNMRLSRKVYKIFKDINKKEIKTLILDLRSNEGGLDSLAAEILSYLFEKSFYYEQVSYYNSEENKFKIKAKEEIKVEAIKIHYSGSVFVLIDDKTASTAEGIPYFIQKNKRGEIVGQYQSASSFAVGLPLIFKMPENVYCGYLKGRALDKDGNIQIDSDFNLNGGVCPDIKIPINDETIYRRYVEKKDVVLEKTIKLIKE